MLDSTVALLRERSASGVSLDAVLAHSGAPRGSIYHHFPRGRDELVLEAVRRAGTAITAFLDALETDLTPRAALERFAALWRQALIDDDFRAGCPVLALAVDHRRDLPAARAVVAEVFTAWQGVLEARLRAAGLAPDAARRRATLTLAAIEGAVVLCRAERSTRPLDDVCAELAASFDPPTAAPSTAPTSTGGPT